MFLKTRKLLALFFVFSVIGLILAGCRMFDGSQKEPGNRLPGGAAPTPKGVIQVTVAAVGDIMMHMPQVTAGYNPSTGAYDFSPFFEPVKKYLSQTDLTLGNLETTLSGADRKFTGYPMFNSPDEIAAALKEAGFDILTTANNHSLDKREYGLRRTIETLDRYGLKHTGTFLTAEDRDTPLMVESKGLKIGFVSFTYDTNGMPVPKGKPYSINLLNIEQISADIKRAKARGADFVVVMAHFGLEYQRLPNDVQRQTVSQMLQAGADIILGSHSHVLQPIERVSGDGREGAVSNALVAYSLGNFISAQSGLYKESGTILYFTLKKNLDTGALSVDNVSFRPTWVHRYDSGGKERFRVLDVGDAMEDYEKGKDNKLSSSDYNTLQKVWQATTKHLRKEEQGIDVAK